MEQSSVPASFERVVVSAGGDLTLNDTGRPAQVVAHPVETIQRRMPDVEQALDLTTTRNVYGAYFPMYLQMNEAFLKEVGRAPHLPSSGLALEVFRGDDENMDFGDVFDHNRETLVRNPHQTMEAKLGIQATRTI